MGYSGDEGWRDDCQEEDDHGGSEARMAE